MERALCLLLLMMMVPPPLRASEDAPDPCKLDDEDHRCVCDFLGPQPDWASGLQCIVAVDVELRAGGRSLENFLEYAETNPENYGDMVRALRLRKLTVGAAQVPARLLFRALRALGYSRLKELTLEDLEVTGSSPPPLLKATGPALSTLRLRNVSWATGGAWLSELQQWLKPGLRVLSIAQAHSLAISCEKIRTFPALTTLDLSDNPRLGERGLSGVLCPHKFPVLRDLALRNSGMETPAGVCTALAAAAVQPHHLDLSRNVLRATAHPGAPRCVWPSALSSLSLSSAGLEQVPKGLPAKLSVLDLSCNKLTRAPRPDELPQVGNLTLDGNPFLDPGAPNPHEDLLNSGVARVCAHSPLALGMSGILALLQRVRSFS
ncbi:monocyte differentiation antigen CD14-like [Tamandua tetradactyla]|uniref:monocyte differentiation antigen CD14-like n=1 Tax=Tamandua tetradactyla TaxID=48850 RepID=UPI00405442B3